jgi:hypothetical protein
MYLTEISWVSSRTLLGNGGKISCLLVRAKPTAIASLGPAIHQALIAVHYSTGNLRDKLQSPYITLGNLPDKGLSKQRT